MPISDELEALRQSSRVKTQSTRLSSASSLYTPQQQEELRKAKLSKEKQSKLEAERFLRSGATYNSKVGDLHDLLGNGMYGRLMNEHRRKVREAQKQLHEWKGSPQGKQGRKDDKNKSDGEEVSTAEKENNEDEEDTVITNAVEMLPDHVVEALKEKYETESIVEALTKALQEEESGNYLSKVVMSPVSKKSDEVFADKEEQDEVEKEEEQQQQDAEEEAYNLEEQQEEFEDAKEELDDEQEQHDALEDHEEHHAVTEEAKETLDEEKPIEEVREKIQNLSINDAEIEESVNLATTNVDAEIEEGAAATVAINDAEVEEMNAATISETKRSPTKIAAIADDDLDCTEQTKLFYNKHADELIAKINEDADALTPTALRNSFLNYLQEEAHPTTKKTSGTSTTIIDLGCGHGRDTLHFSSLGHHVLAVDYSYAMLHHAKTIAPHAHYLNMDMRMLKNLLIDQSVDGIWSHASLSHLPKADLESLLKGLYISVKVGGVLYFSLKVGTHDQMGQAGEVIQPDTRYTPIDNEEDICKFYSYYTSSEVVELLSKTGWEVIKIGEFDQRDKSDYPTHSLLYVFATRRKD